MKRKLLKLTMTVALATTVTAVNAQNVNIPDANFKGYLVSNTAINTNMDAEIQLSEAVAFNGQINCEFYEITDLTGIESFTQLTSLNCRYNLLPSIDLSSNIALTFLNCEANQLTSLDVSNNTALTFLACNNNLMTSLDLTQNIALEELQTVEGQLTSLTLGANTALTRIYCRDNQITSLNLSQCSALTELHCEENIITSLDLSQNTALTKLLCHTNQISSLNISSNTLLETLYCQVNLLASLDVSSNTMLKDFNCNSNLVSSIDVSSNTILEKLDCRYNTLLNSLNVANGNNSIITQLWAIFNPNLACIQVDNRDFSNTNWIGSNFNYDEGLVFLEDCASAGIVEFNSKDELNIFPNPATNNITLNNLTIGSTLLITDMTGKTVLKTLVSSSEMNLDVNNLNNGVYFVQLVNNSEITAANKLVVNN